MIDAAKEGVEAPPEPDFVQMLQQLATYVQTDATTPITTPKVESTEQGVAPGMMNPTAEMTASS